MLVKSMLLSSSCFLTGGFVPVVVGECARGMRDTLAQLGAYVLRCDEYLRLDRGDPIVLGFILENLGYQSCPPASHIQSGFFSVRAGGFVAYNK